MPRGFGVLAGEASQGGLRARSCSRSHHPSGATRRRFRSKLYRNSNYALGAHSDASPQLKKICICAPIVSTSDKHRQKQVPQASRSRAARQIMTSPTKVKLAFGLQETLRTQGECAQTKLRKLHSVHDLQEWFMTAARGQSPHSFSSISPVLLRVMRLRAFSCSILFHRALRR